MASLETTVRDNSYIIDRLIYNDKLQAEKTINVMRLFVSIFLTIVIIVYLAVNKFHITKSEVFDIIAASTSFIHAGVVSILLKRKKLFRPMTFVSSGIDISVVMLSVYAIQFTSENVSSGAISQSFLILTVFYLIILTLRRHDPWNSFFTGIYSGVIYTLFVILMYKDGVFSSRFQSPDGAFFQPDFFFEICKVFFFIISGFAGFVISRKYNHLFWNSIQIESQARETAHRYEMTFSQHQLGTFIIDQEKGLLIENNERFRLLLGIQLDKNKKRSIFWNYFTDDTFKINAEKDLNEKGFFYYKKQEAVIEGKKIWVEGSLTYEHVTNKIHGVIVDITDKVTHQQKLDVLNKKIITDQPLTDIGMNISGFMHNLKGYLSAISQSVEMLDSTLDDNREEIKIPLFAIKNSADIILEMAEYQNDLARGNKKEQNSVLNFYEILDIAIQTISTDPDVKTKIKFLTYISCNDFTGNRAEILSIIYNLLKNAREAVFQTDRSIKIISIKIYDEENQLKIYVQDNGSGMEFCEDNGCVRKSCMDCPYQNFGKTNKEKGSGLGIWSIKQYLKRHHGDIKYISTSGVGTSVIITLPRTGEKE